MSAAPAGPGAEAGAGYRIARGDPLDPALALLHARHTRDMHADTPPGSIHMLPAAALAAEGIAFYVLRDPQGAPAGMGALKALAPGHVEIKSMHVLAEQRGKGLARLLLAHLLAEAQSGGCTRVSLETGAQASFAPARALYLAAGFRPCAPFGGYGPDPLSVFMTLDLGSG